MVSDFSIPNILEIGQPKNSLLDDRISMDEIRIDSFLESQACI